MRYPDRRRPDIPSNWQAHTDFLYERIGMSRSLLARFFTWYLLESVSLVMRTTGKGFLLEVSIGYTQSCETEERASRRAFCGWP